MSRLRLFTSAIYFLIITTTIIGIQNSSETNIHFLFNLPSKCVHVFFRRVSTSHKCVPEILPAGNYSTFCKYFHECKNISKRIIFHMYFCMASFARICLEWAHFHFCLSSLFNEAKSLYSFDYSSKSMPSKDCYYFFLHFFP